MVGGAIRTSNHTAELAKKHCGTAHGVTQVMKDQVLMNLAVGEFKPASLQSRLEPLHIHVRATLPLTLLVS